MGQMGKKVHKKSEFMHKMHPGFSFLQLVIVIAIMAIVGLVVVPNVSKRVPLAQRKEFHESLNALARQAWTRALQTGHVHKILFNLKERTVKLEEQVIAMDRDGKPVFAPVPLSFFAKHYQWQEHLEIKQFYVEGVDEVGKNNPDNTMEDIWFFIVPEGMAQEVIINLFDNRDTHYSLDGQEVSLVLNPFRVQFQMYEEFKNPETV
jgi:type II secretory pathway pseudopilin PulG